MGDHFARQRTVTPPRFPLGDQARQALLKIGLWIVRTTEDTQFIHLLHEPGTIEPQPLHGFEQAIESALNQIIGHGVAVQSLQSASVAVKGDFRGTALFPIPG